MSSLVENQLELCRNGCEPSLICRVPSGWVLLAGMQYLRGYCMLLPDPVVPSINALDRSHRAEFLCEMTSIGDALIEVVGAYRINYFLGGNSDPILHAHIVPRYLGEPEHLRRGGPWSYPQELIDSVRFDPHRDRELIHHLAQAIQRKAGNG
jgi:diadenosine tetraphosphate (Ap4A) HIT family hydrolase